MPRLPVLPICLTLCIACGREADLAQIQREAAQLLNRSTFAADELVLLPPDSLSKRLDLLEVYHVELSDIDTSRLNATQLAQWKKTHAALQKALKQLREHREDPAVYNLGAAIKLLLVNDSLGVETRWQLIARRLEEAPAYYENAQQALQHPSPQRLRLAAQKQMLTLRLINGELRDSLKTAPLAARRRRDIEKLIPAAQSAIKDYILYCNNKYFDN